MKSNIPSVECHQIVFPRAGDQSASRLTHIFGRESSGDQEWVTLNIGSISFYLLGNAVYRDWKPKVRPLLAFVMTKINDQDKHGAIIAK